MHTDNKRFVTVLRARRIPVTVVKPLVVETSPAAGGGGGCATGQGDCIARLGTRSFSPGVHELAGFAGSAQGGVEAMTLE